MSTQSAFTLLVPGSPQKPLPFVLKKIMDNLPPNIMADGTDELEKEKLISTGDGQSCGDGGGSEGSGVSASLTPAIWDKTIPYDGENFHLEYMDLEEFLLENQIPAGLEEELHKSLDQETMSEPPPAIQDSAEEKQEVEALEKEDVEVVGCGGDAEGMVALEHDTEPKVKQERRTPSPVRAEEIEVNVNFQPDLTDLVLSSVPGGELFNPRKHRFSEEELKPQPIIKKARKVFVPEDAKDEKYWSRRKKNNVAAKRSRDARRLKENQIAVRAGFLERENAALRKEVAELRKSCNQCKKVMALYEAKYGPV